MCKTPESSVNTLLDIHFPDSSQENSTKQKRTISALQCINELSFLTKEKFKAAVAKMGP